MYDVCLGRPKVETSQVLLTLTDRDAADRISAAIAVETPYLFQCEGLRPFVRPRVVKNVSAVQASTSSPTRKRHRQK